MQYYSQYQHLSNPNPNARRRPRKHQSTTESRNDVGNLHNIRGDIDICPEIAPHAYSSVLELPVPPTPPIARRSPQKRRNKSNSNALKGRSNLSDIHADDETRPIIVPPAAASILEHLVTCKALKVCGYNNTQPTPINNRLNRAITMLFVPYNTTNLPCFYDTDVYSREYGFIDYHNVGKLRDICFNWGA